MHSAVQDHRAPDRSPNCSANKMSAIMCCNRQTFPGEFSPPIFDDSHKPRQLYQRTLRWGNPLPRCTPARSAALGFHVSYSAGEHLVCPRTESTAVPISAGSMPARCQHNYPKGDSLQWAVPLCCRKLHHTAPPLHHSQYPHQSERGALFRTPRSVSATRRSGPPATAPSTAASAKRHRCRS